MTCWRERGKKIRTATVNQCLNTHRHRNLFALAEQYGVLQHAVWDRVEQTGSSRHGGQVEVKQPLKLIQRQYKMLLERLCHKVLQLWGRRGGGAPTVAISVIKHGGGGTGVTVDCTVRDDGGGWRRGSIHRFILPVTHRFLFDIDATLCLCTLSFGIQVVLEGWLVFLCTPLGRFQSVLPTDMDRLWKTCVVTIRTFPTVTQYLSVNTLTYVHTWLRGILWHKVLFREVKDLFQPSGKDVRLMMKTRWLSTASFHITSMSKENKMVTYLLWMPSHSMCCLWATSGCFLMNSTSVGNRNSQPRLMRGTATCSRNSFTSSGGSW